MSSMMRRLAIATMAVALLLPLAAGPASASSYAPDDRLVALCNGNPGNISQSLPVGFTDEGRYWYIAQVWAWDGGWRGPTYTDYHYMDPGGVNWRSYPGGRVDPTWSMTVRKPSGNWWVAGSWLYNTAKEAWSFLGWSQWARC